MKTYTLQFNNFDITLPIAALEDCYHTGECQHDVDNWMEDETVKKAFAQIDPEKLKNELEDYSDWDCSDFNTNCGRLLWIAAGNYQEEN